MYSKFRLFELKNTKFKTKHHFLQKINYGFRGGLDSWQILDFFLYLLYSEPLVSIT